MSAGTLYIAVKGDTKDLVTALKSAKNASVTYGKEAKQGLDPVGASLSALKTQVLQLGSAWLGAQGIKAVIQIADQYSLLDSKLKLVTKGSAEFGSVYQELFNISQKTGTSFGTNAATYANLGFALKDTNITSAETLKIFDLLNKSIVVSGASTAEASSFLLQFKQGMASGKFAGDEFKSMMDSNSYFGLQLAKALGTDIDGLYKMKTAGELTTDTLRKAFPAMAADIERDFLGIEKTISRSMVELSNAFNDVIADANKTTGGTTSVAIAVSELATTITDNKKEISALFQGIIESAEFAIERIVNVTNSVRALRLAIHEDGYSIWDYITGSTEDVKKRLSEFDNGTMQMRGALAEVRKDIVDTQNSWGLWSDKKQTLADLREEEAAFVAAIQARENTGKVTSEAIVKTNTAVVSGVKGVKGILVDEYKSVDDELAKFFKSTDAKSNKYNTERTRREKEYSSELEKTKKEQDGATEALRKSTQATEMHIYAMNGIEQAQHVAQDSWQRNIEITKEYDKTVENVDVALKAFFDDMPLAAKKSTDEMTKSWYGFTNDAERNFSDVLAGGMKGEISSIGDAWDSLTSSMLNSFINMVADMGAHQIGSALFGESDRSGTSTSSGLLSGLISGAGSLLSGAGSAIADTAGSYLSSAGSSIISGISSVLGFADGGYHPGGWRVVGENGPELAFTGPETILSNSNSTALMDALSRNFFTASQSVQLMNWAIGDSAEEFGNTAEGLDGLSSSSESAAGSISSQEDATNAAADAAAAAAGSISSQADATNAAADAAAAAAGNEFDMTNAAVDLGVALGVAATGTGILGKGLVSVVDHFTGFISSIKASINQAQSEHFGNDTLGAGGYGPNNSFSAPDRDKFGLDAWGGDYGGFSDGAGYGGTASETAASEMGRASGDSGAGFGGGDSGDSGGMGVGDSGGDPGDAGSAGEGPGLAVGGVVNRLMVPRGDDGYAALSFGEGVVSREGMKNLSKLNIGDAGNAEDNQIISAILRVLSDLLPGISRNSEAATLLLRKFDNIGISARTGL